MRGGIEAFKQTGATLTLTYAYSDFAESLIGLGRAEEAQDVLTEASELIDGSTEWFLRAEICRLHGELELLKKEQQKGGRLEDAAAHFGEAIAHARSQQSRSLELRATMSLCKLRMEQGRDCEGLDQLASIYEQFTEGFETPDLKAARELLQA